ncbi:MAG: cupredoxin family copper-binding protein [Xanthobacteraceae bacterium]|nr:cupredoxin family copper-binding protein [Xanthobacteraceae bacterium]
MVSGFLSGSLLALKPLLAADRDVKITIDNFTFTPPEITVPVGAVVTWVNHDDIPHSVVAGDKTFRSKALDTDDSYSFTFAATGTFNYFCGLHPHMTGKVIVKP